MKRSHTVASKRSILSRVIQRIVFLSVFVPVLGDVILYRSEKADPYSYVGTAPAIILGVIIGAMVVAVLTVAVAADKRAKAAVVRRAEVRQPVLSGKR